MNLKVNYKNLRLIPYEGTGNKTPVLDISAIYGINSSHPAEVRKYLEQNIKFRKFLKKEGNNINADSIMLYYFCGNSEYEYVTFVAEPNAHLTSKFSEMCGNGVRALALHIYLRKLDNNSSESLPKKIRVWAGSIKNIEIKQINIEQKTATVSVDLGPFRYTAKELMQYVNTANFKNIHDFSSVQLPDNSKFPFLRGKKIGIGFNGDTLIGEPQAVMLFTQQEYEGVVRQIKIAENDFMLSLRMLTSQVGSDLTFDKSLFPQGINVNIGVIIGNTIYLSTHERNMSTEKQCLEEKYNICRCSTLACGTGGAVAVNIALKQNFTHKKILTTIHPGGTIRYFLENDRTIMVGEAKKVELENRFKSKTTNGRAFLFEKLY